jgi:hypothetical protein
VNVVMISYLLERASPLIGVRSRGCVVWGDGGSRREAVNGGRSRACRARGRCEAVNGGGARTARGVVDAEQLFADPTRPAVPAASESDWPRLP